MIIKWLVWLVLSSCLVAHPVTWSGGRVMSLMSTDQMTDLKAHYSVSPRVSFGLHSVGFDSFNMVMAQANNLLARWNATGAQANVYVFSGIGVAQHGSKNGWGGHFGLQADWETRRLYTFVSYDGFYHDDSIHLIRSRLGVAPYLGRYDDVHAWIMLQSTLSIQSDQSTWSVLPLLRLFKDNVLVELGANFSSRYLITAMIHF